MLSEAKNTGKNPPPESRKLGLLFFPMLFGSWISVKQNANSILVLDHFDINIDKNIKAKK